MRRLLVLLLIAMLAGCGFQLRRELVLPPSLSTLRLEVGDPYGVLGLELEQALRRAGAVISTDADAVLRIPVARVEQLPLSIDANGQVQEFALRYIVEFELVNAAGEVVLPRQAIELERVFQFDSLQPIGTPAEQEIVRAELERDMVASILRRIDAALQAGG